MAHSNTVLSQILKLIPRHQFQSLANQCDGKRRKDALSRWSQFVALCVNHLSGRHSLRDIEATLCSQENLTYHLGTQPISKSSLARANQSLSYQFFETLFTKLYQQTQALAPKSSFGLKTKLFSLDASLIDVSMKIFPHAQYNRMKSAYKLHIGLDHDGLIPAFANITMGKVGDTQQANLMNFPKGSVLIFDRGYSSYQWHKHLTQQGIFYVTRLRSNAKYKVVQRNPIDKTTDIRSDQIIEYTSNRAQSYQLSKVRRVGFYDKQTRKHYYFLTNNLTWSAQTVAQIYKKRWEVELFFKWIKQNLKIKSFLGNSDNAVMTQVMAALCVYLILAFLKFQSKIEQSLQKILRLIQVNLFQKRELIELFKPPPKVEKSNERQVLLWG